MDGNWASLQPPLQPRAKINDLVTGSFPRSDYEPPIGIEPMTYSWTSVRNGFAGVVTWADSRGVVPRGQFVAGFRGVSLTDSLTTEPARSDRKAPL